MIRSAVRNAEPRASAVTSSRLSAEEWYSGKSPCGVRDRVPTGRSNPGEQNWRSSPPVGCQSETMLSGSLREHVRRGAVDRRVTASAALVPQRARVADARDDEPVLDAVERLEVAVEPAERPERPRAPEQPVRVSQLLPGERSGDRPEQHDAGEVVVRERRMADVRA